MTDASEEPAQLQEVEHTSPQRAQQLRSAPIDDIVRQAKEIQEIKEELMQPDEHYGTFFEGQRKPSLLQPGAEKLCSAFGMSPRYDIDIIPVEQEGVPPGHREVRVTCRLYTREQELFLGQGVGECTTMESKYRYRRVEETTDVKVPKAFWKSGDEMSNRDFQILRETLSSEGYDTSSVDSVGVDKQDGTWWITVEAGKAENPDIADTWNTVLKMAKKRALVDAVKTATAASDIFTQDIEDMPDLHDEGATTPPPPQASPSRAPQSPPDPQPAYSPKNNGSSESADESGPQKPSYISSKTWKQIGDIRDRVQQAMDEEGTDVGAVVNHILGHLKESWPEKERMEARRHINAVLGDNYELTDLEEEQ